MVWLLFVWPKSWKLKDGSRTISWLMALQAGLEEKVKYWNACPNQGIKQSCTALQFHAAFEILNECIRFWCQLSKGKNKRVSQYVISGSVFNSFNNFGIEMIALFWDHIFLSRCFHHNLPTKESLGGFQSSPSFKKHEAEFNWQVCRSNEFPEPVE